MKKTGINPVLNKNGLGRGKILKDFDSIFDDRQIAGDEDNSFSPTATHSVLSNQRAKNPARNLGKKVVEILPAPSPTSNNELDTIRNALFPEEELELETKDPADILELAPSAQYSSPKSKPKVVEETPIIPKKISEEKVTQTDSKFSALPPFLQQILNSAEVKKLGVKIPESLKGLKVDYMDDLNSTHLVRDIINRSMNDNCKVIEEKSEKKEYPKILTLNSVMIQLLNHNNEQFPLAGDLDNNISVGKMINDEIGRASVFYLDNVFKINVEGKDLEGNELRNLPDFKPLKNLFHVELGENFKNFSPQQLFDSVRSTFDKNPCSFYDSKGETLVKDSTSRDSSDTPSASVKNVHFAEKSLAKSGQENTR